MHSDPGLEGRSPLAVVRPKGHGPFDARRGRALFPPRVARSAAPADRTVGNAAPPVRRKGRGRGCQAVPHDRISPPPPARRGGRAASVGWARAPGAEGAPTPTLPRFAGEGAKRVRPYRTTGTAAPPPRAGEVDAAGVGWGHGPSPGTTHSRPSEAGGEVPGDARLDRIGRWRLGRRHARSVEQRLQFLVGRGLEALQQVGRDPADGGIGWRARAWQHAGPGRSRGLRGCAAGRARVQLRTARRFLRPCFPARPACAVAFPRSSATRAGAVRSAAAPASFRRRVRRHCDAGSPAGRSLRG